MKKIFISYRQADTSDMAGRIYDRLMGYFGPNRVFIDIDALLAGVDYREQISRMLDQCDLVLVVIGQKWMTIVDDSGRRRLDDPEDLLRIEVATGLKRKKVDVVPLLVHDAMLPTAEELPADIAELANKTPISVRSRLRFNADITNLIEQLDRKYGMKHPDRRWNWEWIGVTIGVALMIVAGVSFFGYVTVSDFVGDNSERVFGDGQFRGPAQVDRSSRGLLAEMWRMFFYSTLPAGFGALLCVYAKWRCCGLKDRERETAHYMYGIGRRPAHKTPWSVLCFALGMASIGWGWLTAVPSFIAGVVAYLDIRKKHGWVRGRSMIAQGVVLALLGGCLQTYVWYDYWKTWEWLSYLETAEAKEASQDLAGAITDLDAAIAAQPTIEAGYQRRGEIRLKQAQYHHAIADFTFVIEKLRQEVDLSAEREFPDRREWLKRALQQRAKAYTAIGEVDKASADTTEIEEVNRSAEPASTLPDAIPPPPVPAPAVEAPGFEVPEPPMANDIRKAAA